MNGEQHKWHDVQKFDEKFAVIAHDAYSVSPSIVSSVCCQLFVLNRRRLRPKRLYRAGRRDAFQVLRSSPAVRRDKEEAGYFKSINRSSVS